MDTEKKIEKLTIKTAALHDDMGKSVFGILDATEVVIAFVDSPAKLRALGEVRDALIRSLNVLKLDEDRKAQRMARSIRHHLSRVDAEIERIKAVQQLAQTI